jgi:hypothetical protein
VPTKTTLIMLTPDSPISTPLLGLRRVALLADASRAPVQSALTLCDDGRKTSQPASSF